MKTIQIKKSLLFFEIIPPNNADTFLRQDKVILPCLESLKK